MSSDISTFKSVQEAYDLSPQSLVFIFNFKPKSYGSVEEGRFVELIQEALSWPREVPMNFVFVDEMAPAVLESYASPHPQLTRNRNALLLALSRAIPLRHGLRRKLEFEQVLCVCCMVCVKMLCIS